MISANHTSVHWRHYKTEELAPEFAVLVEALDEMARRWAGPALGHKAAISLSGKYADQLRLLHAHCNSDEQYTIDVLGYSSGMMQGDPSSPFFPVVLQSEPQETELPVNDMAYANIAADPTNGGDTAHPPPQLVANQLVPQPGLTPSAEMHPDQLSAISHMLMDEDFMAMDRVISLDDMIFAAPQGNHGLSWAPSGNGQVQ